MHIPVPGTFFENMTAEEKEVVNGRYSAQRILALTSGRYALLHGFSNEGERVPIAIGTLEELAPLIVLPSVSKPIYKALAEEAEQRRRPAIANLNLDIDL